MLSVYRIIGTTEGRKNGLLQMKRLCRLLRKQGYHNIKVEEKKIPVDAFWEVSRFDPEWFKGKFLSQEHPTTYFEVTFDPTNKSSSTTVGRGAPVK